MVQYPVWCTRTAASEFADLGIGNGGICQSPLDDFGRDVDDDASDSGFSPSVQRLGQRRDALRREAMVVVEQTAEP